MKKKLQSDSPLRAATCSRLDERDGYLAFAKATQQMLDAAQNAKPRKLRKGYKSRAEYREGYHDGILVVWCMMALVDHPRHPDNAAQIRRILSSENVISEGPPPSRPEFKQDASGGSLH